ncbi:MAG: DUF2062 domain-containing protein [Snodgrassella alvi]
MRNKKAKWIRHIKYKMPTQASLFASPWFKPFARWFDRPYFWQLNRERAASAVAVGMFCGLMPGPTQFFTALIVAYLVRTHLPLALLTTLYTNPLIYVPLYYCAYEIGAGLMYGQWGVEMPALPALTIGHLGSELWQWVIQFGKPLLVGVPVLGMILAALGYFLVWNGWKWVAYRKAHRNIRN